MRLLPALLLVPTLLHAQDFDFYTRGPYRPAVPRPEAVLGYRVGSQQTMFHQQRMVLDAMIAAAPDRARTETFGRTAEGKEMRLVIISAPENLAKLDEIRANLARLADPRKTSASEARSLAERTPITVLLSHSVHGNEPAGFEAAMQTVYQLLASEEPATLEILRNSIVLINPSQNPDGHERFAAWYNSIAVGTDEPAAIEQTEPWSVWGRFNHYRFDMNRDVLVQSQLETQAFGRVLVRWRPQVVVDLHSTTETYFFPPVSKAHNANVPAKTYDWFERFGRSNGDAFDRHGWQYFVRETFDFWYPGYHDVWPTLRGGIGMTYETDGGPELKKRHGDGTVTTFEMAIAHHWTTSMATLQYGAAHRAERLQDFYDFHVTGMADAQKRTGLKRVVFSGGDPERAAWMARRLAQEEIEVTRLTQPWSTLKATPYVGGGVPGKRTFAPGAYVVDLAQPEARLVTAILEPKATWDTAFVNRMINIYRRNIRRGDRDDREDYEFYDITAWSLPLTMGVDAFGTDDLSPVTGTRVTPADSLPVPPPPARGQSAYLFGNESEAGARLAVRLLAEGFRVHVALKPLRADGQNFARTSFVVRNQGNPANLAERIAALSQETRTAVTPVQSAFPDSGTVGVGSGPVQVVRAPRILLAGGDGVDQTSFGPTWWFLEKEIGAKVTPIYLSNLSGVALEQYSVLIIPNGSAGRMWRELGEGGAARLKSWVQSGGAVIAYGAAVSLLNRKELELTTVKEVAFDSTAAKDTVVTPAMGDAPLMMAPGATGGNAPEYVPGSIFRATLDKSHWLTGGYAGNELPVLVESSSFLKPSKDGASPVVFRGKDLLLDGFAFPNNTEKYLNNTVWASVEKVGRGSVIIFAESPVHRAMWRGPARLLTNAILFGPGR
ncbi:MAG TPA: M14 family zinc carboxypeptidase [Gemmatimonadales bacterium]|nr:M14 family zinc carboxypeptidase [Gemmatimonadales bacterium]